MDRGPLSRYFVSCCECNMFDSIPAGENIVCDGDLQDSVSSEQHLFLPAGAAMMDCQGQSSLLTSRCLEAKQLSSDAKTLMETGLLCPKCPSLIGWVPAIAPVLGAASLFPGRDARAAVGRSLRGSSCQQRLTPEKRTPSFLLIVKLSSLPETTRWVVLGVLQYVWGDGCSLRWLPEVVTKSHQRRLTPALPLGKNNGKFSSFLQQNRAIAT
ncbi:uncharacterized protein LOC142599458 isoform X2 [Balearica regulorum gibbericeps]|uniref:uncharacterized protein LOC142599458 isoform X2 n=1 Tax=Balearica regulorum gibbericeps TaxID=100784 RepID=UPI003F5E018A